MKRITNLFISEKIHTKQTAKLQYKNLSYKHQFRVLTLFVAVRYPLTTRLLSQSQTEFGARVLGRLLSLVKTTRARPWEELENLFKQ